MAGTHIFVPEAGASSGGGGSSTSTYATITDESATLTNSRRLTAGSNITLTDGGAGSTLTIAATGGGTVSGTIGPWVDGNQKIKTSGSVSIDSLNHYATDYGTDVFFYVSGTVDLAAGQAGRQVAVFGGRVHASGNLISEKAVAATLGLSGSHTTLIGGASAFIGGTGILVSSTSNGPVVFSPNNNVLATISGSRYTGLLSVDPSQAQTVGTDVQFFVSGSKQVSTGANRKVAVFGGDVVASGTIINAVTSTIVASTYTITANDMFIHLSQSVHNITASLPNPASAGQYVFKDVVGSGSSFPALIKRFASERIDNVASDKVAQSNYGSTLFWSDGVNWWTAGGL